MKTPITPFKMPLDLKEAAQKQASKEGLKLSQLVYKALRLYLNDGTQQKAIYYAKSLAKALHELKNQTQ